MFRVAATGKTDKYCSKDRKYVEHIQETRNPRTVGISVSMYLFSYHSIPEMLDQHTYDLVGINNNNCTQERFKIFKVL